MKLKLLLLAVLIAALSSCTTSYKTGQTPDDVYYSPVRVQEEYVNSDQRNDDRQVSNDEYYDDRYLRMKVHNRTRWSELDDWYYYNNRYSYSRFNYVGYYNTPWTPSMYWDSHYNPYCNSCCVILNPKTVSYNKPRTFNLNTYNSNSNSLINNTYTSPKSSNNNTYTAPRNSTNTKSSTTGNILRDIFKSGSNSSNSNNSNNSSSSGTKTTSSSSSSSSGSTAPVRRF
jgi:hypothetical protein